MTRKTKRLSHASRHDLTGQVIWDHSKDASAFKVQYRRAVTENRMIEFQAPYAPLGLFAEVRAYPSEDGLAIYFRDVTERRELEARLRQAQRLEAGGQLTGGISHDFKNILTPILGKGGE